MKKAYFFGDEQAIVLPFIFLSEVLGNYGDCSVQVKESEMDALSLSNTSPERSPTSFGHFLADKIESAGIIVFDVHDLHVIHGRELREIVEHLRSLLGDTPTDIGIESGRDYYLDRERTGRAVFEANVLCSKSQSSKQRASQLNAYIASISPEYGPFKSQEDKGWGIERRHISIDKVMQIVAEARTNAKGRWIAPSPFALQALRRNLERPLPVGAKEMLMRPDDFNDQYYLSGKFNRNGLPALSLGSAFPKEMDEKSRVNEQHAMWQRRLQELHKEFPEKSHVALCEELAVRLNGERGLRVTKKFNASTIRRNTFDPGHRSPGGSKPKAARSKKP